MKKKVIIGLSGGVDSSVAAFLLKQKGFEVEGIFMRNWESSLNNDIEGNNFIDNNICPQERDFQDALKIAKQLGIKCSRVDFIEEYWQKVFSIFLKQIRKNLTPNPDVLCNNQIKFLTFLNYAKKFKPHYIAMGHYAQIIYKNHQPILTKSVDQNKDQTYFLSQLKKKQLKKIIFPLGKLTKSEVREIARREKLANADKKDSTGICFIGERKFFNFLNNYLPTQKGPIKDINGNFLKEHDGVFKYTIGQRKNLNLKVSKQNSGPWFVVGKDLKNNTLYVDQNFNSSFLYSDSALIVDVIWRRYDGIIMSRNVRNKLKAKFRYRQLDQNVEIAWINKTTLKVFYKQKIKSVTPGQICAFYQKDFCLGAGMILEVYLRNKKLLYT
ncbi:tRNA (5-methylaminomethyl-2-thiouridylate)-methyltransferase [Candidatus Phytoplasma oryzae]|uniref:tRNA-specific 2-thiouridylase MnmA n=1 Tax=Candidatus Phytoplasma oryzae TaxID=203274 RepID=A0A139JQD4_9MOLU|nr:tRNA 2-thiouridine(34) synthase MnmA [Candidatus Phytoplasma oryzae]KXT29187.1 tRNA (5-methylaminomethyl-2-thiouridylate)-methyltransferase [Candidatus Phytoplasma oryzae]KXT29203.1 tRNA (5-methylaminomethyl-2-thiouridylate)-methyltransferase [Candidatus Phytoplasma oryzae]RAM57738.1 thiouridylase [Candidatus Phytoplasma oryzae]